jgi:type II secretory pathway pseudopilin PulG
MKRPAAGFSLMEMIVVLGLFSTVVIASTDIFLLANRSQRKVFGLERIQADARYAMEAIVREVRGGSIDRAYYAARAVPLSVPDTELAMIDSTGSSIVFSVSTSAQATLCANAASEPCLLVAVDGGTPVAMTPKGVKVRSAGFYIAPSTDPFAYVDGLGGYASDEQPRVTVVLALETAGEREGESSVITLQTTAASRSYAR